MGEPSKVHRRLLAEIEAEARDTESWTGRGAFSGAVMEAMARVPRHEFVRPRTRPRPTSTGPLASATGRPSPSPISWR